MQEFILRDGEIAINKPDGTVIIMNTNTYLELQKKIKGENEAHKQTVDRQRALILALLVMLGEAAKKLDEKPANKDCEKVLTPSAFEKWARLPKNQAKVGNKPEVEEYTVKNRVPDFAVPGEWPTSNYVYVADDGKIFRSAAEVEKFYGLAKNSVPAYFADKQKYLYKNKEHVPSARLGVARADCSWLWVNTPAVAKCKAVLNRAEESYKHYKEMMDDAIRWKNA